jgi:hypothetical protein
LPAAGGASPCRACWGTLLGLGVFGLALAVACGLYAGGNWSDLQAQGFSLEHNFWCDLIRVRAINGADNLWSRRWSSIAFAALGLALFCFWRPAGSLLLASRGRRILLLGRTSTLGLYGMALFPSDRAQVLHGVVALVAGAFGAIATALAIRPVLPGEPRASLRRLTGLGLLLSAACNAALYVAGAYASAPQPVAEPVVQKLATASLLAWMLATLRAVRQRASVPMA